MMDDGRWAIRSFMCLLARLLVCSLLAVFVACYWSLVVCRSAPLGRRSGGRNTYIQVTVGQLLPETHSACFEPHFPNHTMHGSSDVVQVPNHCKFRAMVHVPSHTVHVLSYMGACFVVDMSVSLNG